MARNTANVGSSGSLVIDVTEDSYDAVANVSHVSWRAYLDERVSNPSTNASGVPASVEVVGVATVWSGSFSFNWAPAGLQSTFIASGNETIAHNPDGSGAVQFRLNMGNTGTSGAGTGASVLLTIGLTQLTVAPGTPYNVTATRVSDTQAYLTWNQNSASNGSPSINTIQQQINDGSWTTMGTINPQNSANVSDAPNQKTRYRVSANNSGGGGAFSDPSNAIYTTPAAPTDAVATKQANLNTVVTFTPHVGYAEHTHEVWHGIVVGGVTTWDGSPLATLPSGTTSYTHVAPDASKVHIYRVRAAGGGLLSDYAVSNSVQLLVAPNKPTIPAMPAFWDKASDQVFAWNHNSVDTTPQSAYEYARSTDNGATWTSSGKTVTAVSQRTIAAGSFPANTALSMRVRTWGSATTGGSDGTGASPWSDPVTVTFKTVPATTITAPANGGTINESTVRATLTFTQPEAATFVKAQLQLLQGATLLETLDSTILVGIAFATQVQNATSYTVRARVQDSNGLWSAWVSSTFSVAYLPPVPAQVTTSYLPDTGFGQLDLVIPAPGAGQSAATKVSITRTIDGVDETIVTDYPVAAALTFLDTTPTIHGTNTYTVTTVTALGAQVTVTANLVTTEQRKAFLSKGVGYSTVVAFGGNLSVDEDLSVANDTVQASGRVKPIALFGVETSVKLKVKSFIFEGFGSTIPAIRNFLLMPGKACYRDASGRRVFGTVNGGLSYKKATRADLSFTIEETS